MQKRKEKLKLGFSSQKSGNGKFKIVSVPGSGGWDNHSQFYTKRGTFPSDSRHGRSSTEYFSPASVCKRTTRSYHHLFIAESQPGCFVRQMRRGKNCVARTITAQCKEGRADCNALANYSLVQYSEYD